MIQIKVGNNVFKLEDTSLTQQSKGELFTKLISEVLEATSPKSQSVTPFLSRVASMQSDLYNTLSESVSDISSLVGTDVTEKDANISDKYVPSKPVMVATLCPHCGNTTTAYTKDTTINCTTCHKPIDVDYDESVKGDYVCPCCSTGKGFFKIFPDKFHTRLVVKCKSCGSPVDLKYHEKKNVYLSPNLIR